MIHEINAALAIAYRDLLKFLRDRGRLIATLVFPMIFIGALGGSLETSLGSVVGYSFLVFTFTGVFAQTLFQSSALGVISLIEDRENDFSQEMFVAPISRYSIILGKIAGESLVALAQGTVMILFGLLIGVPISLFQALSLIITGIFICLLGGAFGIALLSGMSSQRAAQQIFPFIFFPQFFLAGVFNPIKVLPIYLDILSRIAPLRYAVDLLRGIFYAGTPDAAEVVLAPVTFNLTIITILTVMFLTLGTWQFVRNERNR